MKATDTLDVSYLRATLDLLVGMTEHSTYCYQDLSFQCTGPTLGLSQLDGWYDRDGNLTMFQDSDIGE